MTYMFVLKCALKLVEEIILYYDARSKKHQITYMLHVSIVWTINRHTIQDCKTKITMHLDTLKSSSFTSVFNNSRILCLMRVHRSSNM